MIALGLVCLAGISSQSQAFKRKTARVLFVGNSYTFYNDLPGLVELVARQKGNALETRLFAPGGWTLAKHAASQNTLSKIQQKRWDYVVLQEQSVIPALEAERQRRMYPAVRRLTRKIRQTGAKPVLFMTWGRRNGMPENGFKDFGDMQTRLTSGYNEIAQEVRAQVAPVGLAWQKAKEGAPLLDFWQADNSHPNETGSYLAACVFYAVIFDESPEGSGDPLNLGKTKAAYLQKIAAQTVFSNHEKR